MQGWRPLEPLVPPFTGDNRGCKETFRMKEELPVDASLEGLETTTSLGDLDLIGQLFPLPSTDFTQDAALFSQQPTPLPAASTPAEPTFAPAVPSTAAPARPAALPHSSSSGSSDVFHHDSHESQEGSAQGHDSDKPDTKTAQARYRRRQKDKMADVEHKLEDLQQAIERRLEEQGSLLMQQAGLEKDTAAMQQKAQQGPEWRNVVAEQILDLMNPDGTFRQMRAAEVAAMPKNQFDEVCQIYIQHLAALLLQANGDPTSPAGLQTTAVMQKASLMFCSKARLNPVSLREHISQNRGSTGTSPDSRLSDGAWRGIADAMCLSQEQRQMLLQVRRLYLLRQGQLLRARKDIIDQLQTTQSESGAVTVTDLLRKAGSHQALLQQLNANLEEDQGLFMQFCDKTKGEVLTSFQKAIMLVHTWPHPYDVLELSNRLAQEMGEPSSQQLMELHSGPPSGL